MGRAGIVPAVPTPTMEAIVTLAGVLNGLDYRSHGLTLEGMGLLGMSTHEIRFYAQDGAT